MFRTALSDRRVWLLCSVVLLVVVATRWTLTLNQALQCVLFGGYWIILLLLCLFVRAVVSIVRRGSSSWGVGRRDAWAIAGALMISIVWASHEKPGYKILQDELLLLGTSMGMHYDREAGYPDRATDVQGAFQVLSQRLDKRPLLFPFLVSCVHDVTGYRPQNPFYLNMVLGVIFLSLVYLVGWQAGQTRWAGVIMLLLFAGLPLAAQQSTGGGFELLNLILIATFALAIVRYMRQPDASALEVLIFGTLLLASTRYESSLFLIPATVVAYWGWYRAGKIVLSWPLLLSPVFLVPILTQNRVFSGESSAWELASIPGATTPFGLQYFGNNLGHALAFLFDFSGYQPNSPLFGFLGLLALPTLGLWITRVLRQPSGYAFTDVGWAIVGVSLIGITLLYLLYFWGQFDHPVIHRLSLPMHFLMALALALTGRRFFGSEKGWKVMTLILVGGIVIQGIPAMAKQAYRTLYSPAVQMQIREDFLAALDDRNILFLDNDSVFWITHKIPASPMKQAQIRKDGLVYHLRNHSFSQMYVFQSVRINDQTGVATIEPADQISPDFELELVAERRIQTLYFARISRIKSIREGAEVVEQANSPVIAVPERKSAGQLDDNRALYLEKWIKNLP
jgi:hypothetical protein